MQMISGRATAQGTADYAARFANLPGNFRPMLGLQASSVGLGTYLGEMDSATDELYRQSAQLALSRGINVLDTAVNYRFQRSERALGAAIAQLVGEGKVEREAIIVATKGGYITFDGQMPADPSAWFEQHYIANGLIPPAELVDNSHCLNPAYLAAMMDWSRTNLGLETVDVYFLHNPETQLNEVPRPEFLRRMRAAFEMLEQQVSAGRLSVYGTATWSGYRTASRNRDYLSLAELVGLAREVAGQAHHFKVIQLPFSLAAPEALTLANQSLPGHSQPVTLLEAAGELGVVVWASASLMQGRLAVNLPPLVRDAMAGLRTDAQRALQFVRSTPGIDVALVGMKSPRHVLDNLEALTTPPSEQQAYMKLFKPAGS
jgi:aryl-alcohol dehydrogenase-like predicted oxidoreductase